MKVYLAGPMDFATQEQQVCWRNEATKLLRDFAIETLDPCRRPHTADLNFKEIFNLDMVDVVSSDVMLVDCRDLKIFSFGTPCEVFYANYILKKPVIGWYTPETKPEGTRVFQTVLIDRTFDSLEKAVDHIGVFYK
jgi:nucleoside 2-deoxyribosyltransferase